jgi:hypothetical protein
METMTDYKAIARVCVANQLINMIENNVVCRNGGEPFVNWCEDGAVFAADGLGADVQAECVRIMHAISDHVDKISWELEIVNRTD